MKSIFLTLSLFVGLSAPAADAPKVTGQPGDPETITARAKELSAVAAKQLADLARISIDAAARLSLAKAAHEMAIVRYLEDLREIMRQEYQNILIQQAKFQRLIDALETDQSLVERLRHGHTDEASFTGMLRLMSASTDFMPIREAFTRKVGKLPAINFVLNEPESGLEEDAVEFPGGDIRKLIFFAHKNNLSFDPLRDAHYLVMDALAVITRQAGERILAAEQEIEKVRAQRISETFIIPK